MVIAIEEKDNGKVIRVKKGERLIISLPENASTGYTWLEEVGPVRNMLSLEKEEYDGNHSVIGAPSVRNWTFIAIKAGQGNIKFHYQRPWLEEAIKSFEVTVDIV
ncbi:protease inhibitor I42 family protein [Paenibacillus sp. FSL W8-0186]|uniref:Proteinase inhibitor I42 chagasin domain-containing protein n=1 Tax=Paenibacillus woosongensis TaxID=307580 RepID=A0ABQ4MTW1_9BACL|nr:protease inhibitor I42 family protein [Paenibacillus woosongensis]GIP59350.1 hypothetical protein J15TS10_31640 [Paenibacillus woosongensis]